MSKPVIVDIARTPVARAFKGALRDVRADDLLATALQGVLERVPELQVTDISEVVVGVATASGEQGKVVGRTASLLAGLPETLPALTVSRACASSLQAIRTASHAILAGEGDTYLVGGVEHVSRTFKRGLRPEDVNPRFTDTHRSDYVNDLFIPMGLTAENVASQCEIGRNRMDEFALLSHQRASRAQESGFFDREICAVETPQGEFKQDESPRSDASLSSLANLKPAFLEGGSVTAGNSCPLSDGAAAAVIMSEDRARELGLQPRARILSSAATGLAPEIMGLGPIAAVRLALERAGLTISDIDIIELNEAFAAQVLAVCDELEISIENQLNPNGGAIALGHPFGMTGIRIMSTLLNGLEHRDQEFGLETMCVGGGQGMAMVVQRM